MNSKGKTRKLGDKCRILRGFYVVIVCVFIVLTFIVWYPDMTLVNEYQRMTTFQDTYNISLKNERLYPWIPGKWIQEFNPNKIFHGSNIKPYKDKHLIKCSYKGRVFGIGFFKTGTSSLNIGLEKLGYTSLRFRNFLSSGYNTLNLWLSSQSEYIYPFDILTILMHPQLLYLIQYHSYIATNFGDSPWLYLYKLFDIWYPNSKFIMTINNNTYQTVNSNMKMLHHNKIRLTSNDIDNPRHQFNIAFTAFRYEKHNENVFNYFKDRSNDILYINFRNDSNAWNKVDKFLGCNGITNSIQFDQENKAPAHQAKEFIPEKVYHKIIKNYNIPQPYKMTYNLINSFNWTQMNKEYIKQFRQILMDHYINRYDWKINGGNVEYHRIIEFFDKIKNKDSDFYWLTKPNPQNLKNWEAFLDKTAEFSEKGFPG